MLRPLAATLLLVVAAAPQSPARKDAPEEGIPVTNKLVVEKCVACHKQDEKGNMTRISWERTTPEGWQQAIKRMVRLHGVKLTPEEARAIVRYLSAGHGLAPEEARPAMYQAERRMLDEKPPNDAVRDACVSCHSWGRTISWRRSREEWDLLVKMHIGYFPTVETTSFRRPPRAADAPPPAPGTDARDPVDQAIEHIAKALPLHTPEWAAWRAGMRTPKLAGRWLVIGKQLGRGRVFGEVIIEGGPPGDEFTTKAKLFHVKGGATTTRTGKAIVYAGYAWRGTSESRDADDARRVREVMMVSRDQSQIEGRWFWGGYDEFGIDVTLRRAGNDPFLFGVDRTMLRAGTSGERLRILGDSLPKGLAAADIDMGAGVMVKSVLDQTSGAVTVEVDVAKDAIAGKRDVVVRRSVAVGAFAVYDNVDSIKVLPEAALARLGGAGHPKGYQQFEAVAYHRGPDNKPNTPDDVELGPVDVEWSVEEFYSVYGDDDKEFVGSLSRSGLFTPALEGPNPQRKFGRNNYGDVWVVATYNPGGEAKPVSGRAHLVVTVPLYVRWDQPEVAE